MRRSWFVFKQIYIAYGTVAKRPRCTFCDFRVKAIGYEKWKMTVWFGVSADEGEKKRFFVLKTDKGEVKVLIEEKGFKGFE